MLKAFLFVHFALKVALMTAYGLFALVIVEATLVFCTLLAAVSQTIAYAIWLPCLAIRSSHRLQEYGIPFRVTWDDGFCFGSPRDRENLLVPNTVTMCRDIASDALSVIAERYHTYKSHIGLTAA